MKKRKQDDFDIVAKAIGKYMLKLGWDIAVLKGPKVYKTFGTFKYNYDLTFGFTGKQIKVKNEDSI